MGIKSRVFFTSFALTLLLIGLSAVIIYSVSYNAIGKHLQTVVTRIHEDITYKNGDWDTSAYNADPEAPGTSPLYILTTDGFVIDRWKPIHGFLDVSDFKHLVTYSTPQTIHTITKQDWRIYSQPIIANGKTIGVITVSTYNPQEALLPQIDTKLTQTTQYLRTFVKIQKNNDIAIVGLDYRSIPYDIAFQIVNQFNIIVAKNNNNNSIDRIPNFIDASYVAKELDAPNIKEVTDTITKETFLLMTSPIYSNGTTPVGVIVAGQSISYVYQLLITYLLFISSVGILFSFVLARSIFHIIKSSPRSSAKKHIAKIIFDKTQSILYIDNETIHIPYATNQYVLCKTLCAQPKKRFEGDELLEKFGEHSGEINTRKVYDAMNLINKKLLPILGMKFIVNNEKTYQITPQFSEKTTVM